LSELVYDPESKDYVSGSEYRLKRFERKLLKRFKKSLDNIIPLIVEYLVNNYELEGKIDTSTGKITIRFVKKQQR